MPKESESESPASSIKKRTVLKKGQLVTLSIESLAAGGEGVSREGGMPIFVNRTAPGDRVEVKVFDVRKDFARAEVVRLLETSSARIEPPCKIFKVCGGCQWQHIDYANQLEAKAEIVRQAVRRIGRLDPKLVLPAIGAVQPFFYRNKVQFPVGVVPSTGRVLAGYYEQNEYKTLSSPARTARSRFNVYQRSHRAAVSRCLR
jgi:23S rRNA (uracil1939-C5)-methyltransferase